jgi:hypothetical protein
MPMIKELNDVIARLGDLSEERQQAAAVLLLDFLEGHDIVLTPEQVAEVERSLRDEDFATDDEVRAFLNRIRT